MLPYDLVKLLLVPLGSVPPFTLYFIVYVSASHPAYMSFTSPCTFDKSVVPSYQDMSPLTIYQPTKLYPCLLGLAKVIGAAYVFVKVSPVPLGSVPSLTWYLIVYVIGIHFAYIYFVSS